MSAIPRRTPRLHRLIIAIALGAIPLVAQTPPETAPPPKPATLALAAQAHCDSPSGQSKNCEIGDTLTVEVANLRAWMESDAQKNEPRSLVLVLDDRVMKGLTARGPDAQFKQLYFDLKRLGDDHPDAKDNRQAWNDLLSRSKSNRRVSVGVALNGVAPYYGTAAITLQVFPSYSWLVVVFLLALVLLFVVLARMSDIVRDAPSAKGAPKLSFSLAKCQMAWWFFIVVGAYNYIWMVTGDRDSLTSGALILMGISAATGLGSVMLDSTKRSQRLSLQNERDALTAQLAATPPPANAADLQARLAGINTEFGKLPTPPTVSEGFLADILRDETGVSLHRFQMATWTIVLGFVFIVTVYRSLAMPDFSATLLGLMGISAGTYIGFKIPESPK